MAALVMVKVVVAKNAMTKWHIAKHQATVLRHQHKWIWFRSCFWAFHRGWTTSVTQSSQKLWLKKECTLHCKQNVGKLWVKDLRQMVLKNKVLFVKFKFWANSQNSHFVTLPFRISLRCKIIDRNLPTFFCWSSLGVHAAHFFSRSSSVYLKEI